MPIFLGLVLLRLQLLFLLQLPLLAATEAILLLDLVLPLPLLPATTTCVLLFVLLLLPPLFSATTALLLLLLVFIFVMTGIVFETQHRTNEDIGDYADALYFTVTALTTTGFGDITLEGNSGRMISVLIMIFGVTLFLRLAQVLSRPTKVRFTCPTSGLSRHEPDAVHCKACGAPPAIPDEGADP